jgi:hypothetical protein
MSISIRLVGSLYAATVTPPDCPAFWATSEPMDRDALIVELRDQGCHTTDISDAFYATDPDWLPR